MDVIICAGVFVISYAINMTYMSVFLHRGITHHAFALRPFLQRWVAFSGPWVTGLDPKAWACMHRRHHQFSDTAKDPHSPMIQGVFGVLFGQLKSYERTLISLVKRSPEYTQTVSDLKFDVNWLYRKKGRWVYPYLLHVIIAALIAWAFGNFWVGVCYWVGLMSHPVQGWLVNSFAHYFGYRNFKTDDNSRNNPWVAAITFGEGFQNNHHHNPRSAKFSYRWFEFDLGFAVCRVLQLIGLGVIKEAKVNTRLLQT